MVYEVQLAIHQFEGCSQREVRNICTKPIHAPLKLGWFFQQGPAALN